MPKLCDRKFIQYDTAHKLINQQSKAIGKIDFDLNTAKEKKTASEIDRLG